VAKNYASIYNNTGDSSALNQRFYVKLESVRGVLQAPTGADFIYTLGGGSMSFSQPFNPSPVRSGRHNKNVIYDKKALEWSFPTFVMIDTTEVSAGVGEVDPGIRLLWRSALGYEETTPLPLYDSRNDPDVTFSLYEVGDMWANQARGCVVNQVEIQLPGDGQSQLNWSGFGAESIKVGIGKSVTNNTANTVTLGTGEGFRFPVGALVMIVEANGTTRSGDTPDGSPRKVTAVSGDVVTLDGAALTDADGSGVGAPIYLVYYEPATPVAIDNPQIGLVGTFTSSIVPGAACIRSATITLANNHEPVNYCWGKDALSGAIFVPADRLAVNVSIEMNLNHDLIEYYNRIQKFASSDLQFDLGATASRFFRVLLPKVLFNVPAISLPDTGSIPVTFEGLAVETAEDAADEIRVSYR
jgi:Phage tail tube protein